MKKTLLFCGLLMVISHGAGAEVLPGPYVGVSAGYADTKLEWRDSAIRIDGLSVTGASVGLLAGYLAPAGRGAFGIEGFATLEDGDARVRAGTAQVHVEARESYGATALAGGFVGSALLYARAGYGWQRGKLTLSDVGYSEWARQTYKGPGVGIGMAAPLTRRLAVRVGYMRWFYKEKLGYKPEQGRFDVALTHSF